MTWFHSAQVNKLLSDSHSFPNSCYPSAVANSVWGSHCCLAFFFKQTNGCEAFIVQHPYQKSLSNPFRRLESEQRFARSESDGGDVGGKKFNILFSFTFHTAGLWTQPLEVYVKDFSDLLLSLWVIETGLMTRYEQTVLQATGDIIFGTVQTSNVVTERSYSFWGHTRKTTQAASECLIKSNPFTWVLFLPPFLKNPPHANPAPLSRVRGGTRLHINWEKKIISIRVQDRRR